MSYAYYSWIGYCVYGLKNMDLDVDTTPILRQANVGKGGVRGPDYFAPLFASLPAHPLARVHS